MMNARVKVYAVLLAFALLVVAAGGAVGYLFGMRKVRECQRVLASCAVNSLECRAVRTACQ